MISGNKMNSYDKIITKDMEINRVNPMTTKTIIYRKKPSLNLNFNMSLKKAAKKEKNWCPME